MLQQIWDEHRRNGGEDESAASAQAEEAPSEGTAEDGVAGTRVHALVVTHGAYMRVAVRYFVEELRCPLPPGSDETTVFSISPNTGLCRFMLTMREEGGGGKLSKILCVFVHRDDHVKNA